ncbi:olfactory receptor class A-like protein 1 [Protopterus annectens]|uniref:olfactory receptor class A-like protein 1 n=1 Tax=Protopterus annectens TaxID=7888 RepID=UPI001CFB4A47|nr:olfactory receptor class A-like protein 1 [Protopterus annectens]
MDLYNLIKGLTFLLMTLLGIFGNAVIALYFLGILHQKQKLKTSDVILSNLPWTNLIMILTRGVPHSLLVFGIKNMFNDVSCKVITFAFRVSRAMSICLTCLLSCYQCATVASSNPKWSYIKHKMQTFLLPTFIFLLILNSAVHIAGAINALSGRNSSRLLYTFNMGYCIVVFPDQFSFQANGYSIFTRDLVFVVLMTLASIKILLILYYHGKRIRGIKNPEENPESTKESRASKMIVILVSLYVFFFGIDSTIWLYQTTVSSEVHIVITDIRFFFSICYGSFFPIVILTFNKKIRTALKYSASGSQQEENDISYIKGHNE